MKDGSDYAQNLVCVIGIINSVMKRFLKSSSKSE